MAFLSSSYWKGTPPFFTIWYVCYGCGGDDFHALKDLLRLVGFCLVTQSFVFSEQMLNVVVSAFSYSVSLYSLLNTKPTVLLSDKLYVALLYYILKYCHVLSITDLLQMLGYRPVG